MNSSLVENPISLAGVLDEVWVERARQFSKWGPQHHPDGTGPDKQILGTPAKHLAEVMRATCDMRAYHGEGSWLDILLEEVFEGSAESGHEELRKELLQIAAVAVAWIEDIDSRD